MANAYLGEIRLFGFVRDMTGWLPCDGREVNIPEHEALFSLIGMLYGGDGKATFGLPDLRGRVPVHCGAGPGLTPRPLASAVGVEMVALTEASMPSHSHAMRVSTAPATEKIPAAKLTLGSVGGNYFYAKAGTSVTMSANALAPQGGAKREAHGNIQPTVALAWYIATLGEYPVS